MTGIVGRSRAHPFISYCATCRATSSPSHNSRPALSVSRSRPNQEASSTNSRLAIIVYVHIFKFYLRGLPTTTFYITPYSVLGRTLQVSGIEHQQRSRGGKLKSESQARHQKSCKSLANMPGAERSKGEDKSRIQIFRSQDEPART